MTSQTYLAEWAESFARLGSLELPSAICVTGERNQHLGPSWQYARVHLTAYPASALTIIDEVPRNEEFLACGYPEWAIFGLLDVLLGAQTVPLYNVRIVLEKVDYDPIQSSPVAFRFAGRDAGRLIIESLRK